MIIRFAVAIVPFVALTAFAEFAHAQTEQRDDGANALRDRARLTLLDDSRLSEVDRTPAPPQRFTIVVVRAEAILLDTATGETWRLMFSDSKNAHWQPVRRLRDTNEPVPPRAKKRADRVRKSPSKESEFDPFRADDEETRERPD